MKEDSACGDRAAEIEGIKQSALLGSTFNELRVTPMNAFPQAPEQPAPYLLRRDRLARAAPHIESVLQHFLAFIEAQGGETPACPGLTIPSDDVRPLLTEHLRLAGISPELVSAQTLILCLPADFDLALEELVTAVPKVLNHDDIALRNNRTYLAWHCCLPGEGVRTDVWVPDSALTHAAFDVACRHREGWGWVPVIALAGDIVAVGGFAVDLDFVSGVQAACMSAQSTVPEDVYSDEELLVAASEATALGLNPWLHRRCVSGYGNPTLMASVYARNVG